MKVLLVDDEKKFAMMLAKRLALRDIEVDFVFSGEEALLKAENSAYNVAVLDVKMPGLSGIELERLLRKLDPAMKIIFLTGHGSKADFEAGSAEAAYYLAKPIQIEELIKILHEVAG